MIKNLLIKLASAIIRKYGVVNIGVKTKLRFNNIIFEIESLNLSQSIYYNPTLSIECTDILNKLNEKIEVKNDE